MANMNDHTGRQAVTILPPVGKSRSTPPLAPYTGAGLPARPAPAVPYADSRMSRRRLVKLADNLSAATAATDAGTRYYGSLGALEAARQETERIHASRQHLPLVIETQRLALLTEIGRGRVALDAVQGELEQRRIEREQHQQLLPLQVEKLRDALEQDLAQSRADAAAQKAEREQERSHRERQRQLEDEEFEIRRMELAARRQAAEARLRQAAALSELRGQAERHRAEAEVHRTHAEAEKMRRSVTPPETCGIPEHLRQHLAAELEVKRNRAPAAHLAQAIRDRAAAQGRVLTDEELELIDLYESAAAAAEESIRRGEASDIEE